MSKIVTNQISPQSGNSVTINGDVSIGGTLTYEDVTNIDVVGVITARSDVSIADKIIHTGDTNTSIRFPAADTFTVETGGSERLRVSSAGNVGIATASPDNQLHVFGATTSAIKIETGDGGFNPILIQENPDRTWHTGLRGDVSDSWVVRDASASSNRLVITSAGKVGLNNNTPTDDLDINVSATGQGISLRRTDNTFSTFNFYSNRSDSEAAMGVLRGYWNNTRVCQIALAGGTDTSNKDDGLIQFFTSPDSGTGVAERMRITSAGKVGINATSPIFKLDVVDGAGGANTGANVNNPDALSVTGTNRTLTSGGANLFVNSNSDLAADTGGQIALSGRHVTSSTNSIVHATIKGAKETSASGNYNSYLAFGVSNHSTGGLVERLRIDSSGRVLIGTSSNFVRGNLQVIDGGGGEITLGRNDTTVVTDNDIGHIYFSSNDETGTGVEAALISAYADANHTSASAPTRLTFSTAAVNHVNPTERMRITSGGSVFISHIDSEISVASASTDDTGISLNGGNTSRYNIFVSNDATTMYIGRQTSDGNLIEFRQGGTQEGSISVSGSTVSYNGGHLSRYSQLAGGAERTAILRGSVLSNLDEMCEWGEENNEQLNRMKVSDVEGDVNVAGVFQNWDDDDDTYTNDFYCSMTGDFVIRIAQGTTVARGDLLMSAGDGTAKPQGDDIVRSKTIAKVTSTNVSTTYSDGSYCVPCVLMAC